MHTLIYHNPRCSKSRQTLELVKQHHPKVEVVEYLKTPPDRDSLIQILAHLQMEPRQLMRKGEVEYTELGLDNPQLSRDDLVDAMLAHPKLIERPIVVRGNKAALGRPPESVLEIL
jgi:arsenate reductase